MTLARPAPATLGGMFAAGPRGAVDLRRMGGNGLVASPEQRAATERLTATLFPNGGGRRAPEPFLGMPSLGAPAAALPLKPAASGLPLASSSRPNGLRNVVGIVGDALAGMAGLPPQYAMAMEQRRREAAAQAQAEGDFQRRLKLMTLQQDAERSAPQFFESNGDRVRFDPVTGQSTVVYDAPSPFDEYARSLGLEPGTDDYATALQDYVLRHSGPTATENDLRLEDERQENRVALEGVRMGNRVRLRGLPTYRQANPLPRAPRRAAPRSRSARPGGAPSAVNPRTGERLVLRNGQWVSPEGSSR